VIQIHDIRRYGSTQMNLVEDEQVVETPSSRRLYPPLRNRVRSGRSERRSDLLDAEMPQAAIECHAIPAITVVNQKPRWPSIPSAALHYLLGPHFAVGNEVTATCKISLLMCRTTKKT
jgi:hypothetical protein